MDTLIPYDSLAETTLQTILEEVVSRDGTDYGEYDVSLAQKVSQVMGLLSQQQAFLVFDTESETIKLLSKDQLQQYEY